MEEIGRWLIAGKRDIEGGVEVFKEMAKVNKVDVDLGEEVKDELRNWVEGNRVLGEIEDVGNMKALFKEEYGGVTWKLWIVWAVSSVIYYGNILVMPLFVETKEKGSDGIWAVLWPILGEFPAMVVGYAIVEREIFGRRGTIFYGLIGTSVMSFLGWGLGFGFVVWATMARAIVSIVASVVYPFTLEIYPTPIRGTALSMASGCGSIGGVFTPWIVLSSFKKAPKSPFFIFGLLAGIGAFCTWKIKTDTTNKELDIQLKVFPGVEAN
jgi:hypothetical protein